VRAPVAATSLSDSTRLVQVASCGLDLVNVVARR